MTGRMAMSGWPPSSSGEDADLDEVLATILNTTICRALAFFDFALETGEEEPLDTARVAPRQRRQVSRQRGERAAVVDDQPMPASDRRPMAAFAAS